VAGVLAVSRLRPKLLLGPHGAWAFRRAEEFARQGSRQVRRLRNARAEDLAKANSK
jgi:hypothetical protein